MADEQFRTAAPLFQPDVMAYRLGQVESQATHTDENLDKLTKLVTEFMAEMPAKYVPRSEHEAAQLHKNEWSFQKTMMVFGAIQLGFMVVNLLMALLLR